MTLISLRVLVGLVALGASDAYTARSSTEREARTKTAAPPMTSAEETRMWMTIGERRFAITPAGTEAARAFATKLPLELNMSDLNGNEKHADLSAALPASPTRPGTIRSGDLMLYGAKTVVVFYETFESPYAYTPLGHVDEPTNLSQALGRRRVRIVFSRD